MKTSVGFVTQDECKEIQSLYERRNGLTELGKILSPDNAEMYEKLVQDLGRTSTLFQSWWDRMYAKYQWQGTPNGHWEIDFASCEVFLVTPEADVKIFSYNNIDQTL